MDGIQTQVQQRRVVIPGDRIPLNLEAQEGGAPKVRAGPGLQQEGGELIAVKPGCIKHGNGNKFWVDGSQKRYVPAVGEPVLGTITGKFAESYKVDIGSAHPAMLPVLAFEGASRKNRPMLDVGALVYCRVAVANKDMEPELECIAPSSGKSGGYGPLKNGFVVRCSSRMARSLLDPKNPILLRLAEAFSFEMAVGLNGRVWFNADTVAQVIAATKAIQACDGAAAADHLRHVNAELRILEGIDM
ncbi:hypothetical protein DFJ77DRAFT_429844 [Powellomyces hirtus]|nr:hypothetical protein DFJ77DRAFT_429844 [Powellomyces hirtus]